MGGLSVVALGLMWALVLLATLFRGGNRHVPLIGLEWLGLLVLVVWGARALLLGRWPEGLGGRGSGRAAVLLLAAAPVWVALLQAVPWPGLGATTATPEATWHAALVGLAVSACFLMGLSAQPGHTRVLLKLWVGVAVAQAALGLIQLGGAEALHFGLETSERAIGTFASKNTYSNFLVMAMPLAMLWLLNPSADAGAAGEPPEDGAGRRWLWGLALFTLMSAVIASTSRTGIATGLLVALLAVALLPEGAGSDIRAGKGRAGSPRGLGARWWLLGGGLALLLLALMAGGLDWVDRFDSERLLADDARRGLMRDATWQGALAFWPWGSGMGSYATVFPRFQPDELGPWLVDNAHSEYLQSLMEMGAAFVIIAAVALALIGRRLWRLARAATKGWAPQDRLAVACGIGALATALHAWVDYPFRIPANAMMAAFLLGVFLREAALAPAPASGSRPARRSRAAAQVSATPHTNPSPFQP
jgi:hypothetical protein